jgi:hypothetical protein
VRTLVVCAVVLILAACQSARLGDPVEGRWASDDGVFVATFDSGAFTSRLTGTGETVVANGRYSREPGGLLLEWTSIAANERRAARCRFLASNQIACEPTVGDRFTMTRVA